MKIKKTLASVMAMSLALSAMSSLAVTSYADDDTSAVTTSEKDAATAAAPAAVDYASAKTIAYDLTTPYNTVMTTIKCTGNNIALGKDTTRIKVGTDGLKDLANLMIDKKGRQAVVAYDVAEIKVTIKSGNSTATAVVSSDTASKDYDKDFDDAFSDLTYTEAVSKLKNGYTFNLGDFDDTINSFKQIDNTITSISDDEVTKDALPFGDLSALCVDSISVDYTVRARTISKIDTDTAKAYVTNIKNATVNSAIGAYDKYGSATDIVAFNISNKKVSTVAEVRGVKSYDAASKTYTFTEDEAGRLLESKMDAYTPASVLATKKSITELPIYQGYAESGLSVDNYVAAILKEINGLRNFVNTDTTKYYTKDEAIASMKEQLKSYVETTKYLKEAGISAADLEAFCTGKESKETTDEATGKTLYIVDTTKLNSYKCGGVDITAEDVEVAQTCFDNAVKAIFAKEENKKKYEAIIDTANVASSAAPVKGLGLLIYDIRKEATSYSAATAGAKAILNAVLDTEYSTVSGSEHTPIVYNPGDGSTIATTKKVEVTDASTSTGSHVTTSYYSDIKLNIASVLDSKTDVDVDFTVDDYTPTSTSDDYKGAKAAIEKSGVREKDVTNPLATKKYVVSVKTQDETKPSSTSVFTPAVDTSKATEANVFALLKYYSVKSDKDSDGNTIWVSTDNIIKDTAALKTNLNSLIKALNDANNQNVSGVDKLNDLIKKDKAVAALVQPATTLDNVKATATASQGTYSLPMEVEKELWYYFAGDYDYRNSSYFLAEMVDTIGSARGAIVSFHVDPNSLKKNEDLLLAYVDAYDAYKFFNKAISGDMVLRVNGASTNAFTNLISYDPATSTMSFQWDDVTGAKFTDNILYVRSLDIMSSIDFDMDAVQITIPDQAQFAQKPEDEKKPEDEQKPEDEKKPEDDNDILDEKPADDDDFEDNGDDEINSGESEENQSTIIQEPEDDDTDDDTDDIDLGNDDIFGDDEDDSLNNIIDNNDSNTDNVPVIDNVTPTPVEPTPVTPTPTTPSTGDAGVMAAIPALVAGAVAAAKRKFTK